VGTECEGLAAGERGHGGVQCWVGPRRRQTMGKSSLRRPVEIPPTFEPNRGRRNRVRTI
jgi:hypothetical protein